MPQPGPDVVEAYVRLHEDLRALMLRGGALAGQMSPQQVQRVEAELRRRGLVDAFRRGP